MTPCQRWRRRRDSYRPAGEPIDPAEYDVVSIDELAAKRFVVEHHYSASYSSTGTSSSLSSTPNSTTSGEPVAVRRQHIEPVGVNIGISLSETDSPHAEGTCGLVGSSQ